MTANHHSARTEPLISIVIPVYNVEHYIGECLSSVLGQQGEIPAEAILVDDCGTDNSMACAREVLAHGVPTHLSVRFLEHEKNRGLSAARNTGTAAARGKYILYLDSDDSLMPDALATLLREAQESGADITAGGLALTSPVQDPFYKAKPGEWRGDECAKALFSYTIQPMAWNKLIQRDFLENSGIRFREGLLHEDELWMAQLALIRPHIRVSGRTTYLYRNKRPDSIMSKAGLRNIAAGLEIARAISPLLDKEQPEVRESARTWLLNHVLKALLVQARQVQIPLAALFRLGGICRIIARHCTPSQQSRLLQHPNLRYRRIALICRSVPRPLRAAALFPYLCKALWGKSA